MITRFQTFLPLLHPPCHAPGHMLSVMFTGVEQADNHYGGLCEEYHVGQQSSTPDTFWEDYELFTIIQI